MKFRGFSTFGHPNIDRDKGIIYGVSVVTIGEAQGHNVFIDQTTLETVLAAAKKYKTGVKVKWNPATNNHGDGSIPGFMPVESFRIDGNALRADIHVRSTYQHKEDLLNLCEEQGDQFGLSMDFDMSEEEKGEKSYARCSEIFAATVVDQPAANPSGLWSLEKPTNKQPTTKPMAFNAEDKKELAEIIGEALKPVTQALATTGKAIASVRKEFKALSDSTAPVVLAECDEEEMSAAGVEEEDDDETKMSKIRAYRANGTKPVTMSAIDVSVARAVGKAMTKFSREAGGPPAKGSAKSGGEDDANKGDHPFVKKVRLQMAAGCKKVGLAVRQAAGNNAKEYEDYVAKVGRGEVQPVEATISAGE